MIEANLLLKVYKALPVAGLLLSPDAPSFTILEANNAYLRATGLLSEDLIGKSFFELFPKNTETGAICNKSFLNVIETKTADLINYQPYPFKATGAHTDVRSCWNLENIPVGDNEGNTAMIIHTVTAVTERATLKEQTVPQSKLSDEKGAKADEDEQFRLIVRDLQVGVLLQGPDTEILCSNPKALELLGLDEGQLVGKTSFDPSWKLLREDGSHFPDEELPVLKAFSTGISVRNTVMGVYSQTKGYVWLLVDVEPRVNEKGKVTQVISTFLDITKRKKAEDALKASEERYRSILTASPDEITITDLEGKILLVSPAALSMLGCNTEEEILGRKITDFIIPEDRKLALTNLSLMFQGIMTGPGEYHGLRSDGGIFNMEANAEFIRDNNGQPVEIVFIVRDITLRKQMEEELNSQKKFFEQMFMQSCISTIILDKNGRCERINPKLSEIFGVDASQVEKKYNILQDEAVKNAGYMPQIETVFKDGKTAEWEIFYEPEIAASSKNIEIIEKKKVWYHSRAYPIFDTDSKLSHVIVQHTDITEEKKGHEALLLSNERYNLVAKATNDAIWDWNVITGAIERTGDGLKILFGYDTEFAKKEKSFWSDRIHPDDLQKVLTKRELIFADHAANYWDHEYRFKKANGDYAIIYEKGYIIRDEDGKPQRVIGATQDITRLRENEINLNELNEHLRLKAKELADSNAELEQFAYVASHDLQEPLRMVTGFLTHLEKKYSNIIDDVGKKYIFFAVDGANRMRQIILDLLEFSRLGRKEGNQEELDLNLLIKQIELLFHKQIQDKKATIETSELPVIKAFSAPLNQVFQNLIGNALKYSRTDIPAHIRISAKSLNTHWQFAITDNGIGISNEYFDKIFVIFQRLHNKDEYSGTGIGLAITKKVVENHDGKIWVESEEGKGSTFYFTIKK